MIAALLDPQEAAFVEVAESKAIALLLSIAELPPEKQPSTSEQPKEFVSEFKKSMLAKLDPTSNSNIISNYLKTVKNMGALCHSIDSLKYWHNVDPTLVFI